MSLMVKEQAEGGVQLTGLQIYRWNDALATYKVAPNKGLFIFKITNTKHEIKHPPLVIDFELDSLRYAYNLALSLISRTKFFSAETAPKLAQQLTEYINGCISFHVVECSNSRCGGSCGEGYICFTCLRRPRHVFVADVVLRGEKEPQGNGPLHLTLQNNPYTERQFKTTYRDVTECIVPDVDNIEEFRGVVNILLSWINPQLTDSVPSDQQKLRLDLVKLKPTLEIIDQVAEYVDDNDCSICFRSSSEKTQIVKMVRCKHEFHSHCIFKWLTINQSCPNCRTSSLFNIYL